MMLDERKGKIRYFVHNNGICGTWMIRNAHLFGFFIRYDTDRLRGKRGGVADPVMSCGHFSRRIIPLLSRP